MIHICLYCHLDLLLICILFYDITLQLNLGVNGLLQICLIPVTIIFVFPLPFTFDCAAFLLAKKCVPVLVCEFGAPGYILFLLLLSTSFLPSLLLFSHINIMCSHCWRLKCYIEIHLFFFLACSVPVTFV